MTTINSATTSLYVSQTTINISSIANRRNDDDQQRPAVSGRGEKHGYHHHGGGVFMQNVVQTLQSFGLNFPGAHDGSSDDEGGKDEQGNASNSSGNLGQLLQNFLRDLREVLKSAGGQQSAGVQADATAGQTPPKQAPAASSSAPAGAQAVEVVSTTTSGKEAVTPSGSATTVPVATTATPAPRASVAEVRHALHGFLHELRQALKYSADRRQGGADDNDGDRSIGRNGYGRFTDNLQNLITTLSDNVGANAEKFKALQDGFSHLLNVLGGATDVHKPTLLEFLNKLAGNNAGNNPASSGVGSIVSTKA